MKKRSNQSLLTILLYFLAFTLPIVIVMSVFYYLKMYPFGEFNVLVWDLQITYSYFYEWYRSILLGGGNIFYSLSKSLGGNMFPGWSCLLASPVCLLVVLFSKTPVEFATFMIVVKFGLAGITSLFYLRNRFKLQPVFTLCLSIGYSMMLFMTSQSANPMWIDAVIILPLVMYGVYSIVTKGRVVLFTISLLLTILINFYNGYMVCIFSILFYLFESYLAIPQATATRYRILVHPGRFAISYSLAILSSCIVLVPTAIGLFAGKGAIPPGFMSWATRFGMFDLPRSVLLGVYEKEYLPQLYCGTLALIAVIWFFIGEKIDKREKKAAALFISIMVLSMWLVIGDRFWLGFRDGNSFYCRFAFLAAALLIFCAARALESIRVADIKKLATSACIVALIAVIIYLDNYSIRLRYLIPLLVLCLTLPFGIYLVLRSNNQIFRNFLSTLLVIAVCCEATLSWSQIESYRVNENNNFLCGYQRYVQYYAEGSNMITSINNLSEDPTGAYRVEKTFNLLSPVIRLAQNDSMAFGYHGVALYDSLYDRSVQKIVHNLGYSPDVEVRITYTEAMLVADTILGIRFILDEDCPAGYQESRINHTWEDRKLYENPYALPLGFGCSSDILTEIKFKGNPFDYQNALLSALCGTDDEYLVRLYPDSYQADDLVWSWQINCQPGTKLYGYIQSDQLYWKNPPALYINSEYRYVYLSEWSQGMFAIEPDGIGGLCTVTLRIEEGSLPDDLILHLAYLDENRFLSAVEQLRSNPLIFTSFEDGYIAGSYYAEHDGLLFTTIPYDPGWTIKVNGSEIQPKIAQNAFIVLEVSENENYIEMSYLPPGLIPGMIISLLSIMLFMLFAWYIRRQPITQYNNAHLIETEKGQFDET
jgi:uncharacterized membrane protein YfhO